MHISDPRPDATRRLLEEMGQKVVRKPTILADGRTALGAGLSDFQKGWLVNYCIDMWLILHSSLGAWRAKLEKFERMAADDRSDRLIPNPDTTDALASIFTKQNHTLGFSSGTADFVFAQARDEIFGTRPWIGATPIGIKDQELADTLPKHTQWKFDQSNIEATFIDSLRLADDLGTQFVQIRWLKDVETFERLAYIAVNTVTGEPFTKPSGDYVTDLETAQEMGLTAENAVWEERLIEETQTTYNNIVADNLDFKDVAFDNAQPELSLRFTPFFHQFRMGLLDVVSFYDLDDDQKAALSASMTGENSNARDFRDENLPDGYDRVSANDNDANPKVVLVEGWVYVDPFQKGKPKRIHVVFDPNSHTLVYCEYLANDSPDGLLPVFPVRCFKVPNRIYGRGYWEKYEDCDTAIDYQFNTVTYHNRRQCFPVTGWHRDALLDSNEGKEIVFDPEKPFDLAPGMNLKDFIEFLAVPDLNSRSVELLNQMFQTGQMRSGVTSAAQGELKGVPQSNTATGVNAITSRGAVLTKWPIDQQITDIEKAAEYSVHVIYANQDHDETFNWGDGKDTEILTIKAGDVKGLRANVNLTLVQADNQNKLQGAQVAANMGMQYAGLPEIEKQGQRRLYTQAVASLGFNDAEKIIRPAAVDPQSLLEILPPELQGPFAAFMQQQMAMAPAADGTQPQPPPANSPDAPGALSPETV